VRKVAREAGIDITLTGLAAIYSDDPDHAPANPRTGRRQQPAGCFQAIPSNGHPGYRTRRQPQSPGTAPVTSRLTMYPTVRKRLTYAMARPATASAASPHEQSPLTKELLRQ